MSRCIRARLQLQPKPWLRATKLPPRHLETLLQGLVHAKILKGVRGPNGGYELAHERRRITVGEIVRTAMSLSTADPRISAQTPFCSSG
jgi:DNA-binding IscR family transcriptional regulator